jgi:uncharacterized protein
MATMLREPRLKFTRESSAMLSIRSVSGDGIQIDEDLWLETVALTPNQVIPEWRQVALAELVENDFLTLLEHSPELIIVGTGATNVFPPRELTFAFARRGVGFEVMDTAAAARTFNVLAGEGRQVAALLYPLS